MTTIPKNALVLMVGPSGAGKSTLAEKSFEDREILSSDKIRIELTGGFEDQSRNKEVFELLHARVRQILHDGGRAVIDATNLKKRDRKTATEFARTQGFPIYYVVWDRDLEDKMSTAGWRDSVVIPTTGKKLVEHHHDIFKNNEDQILNGDGWATVIDARKESFTVE